LADSLSLTGSGGADRPVDPIGLGDFSTAIMHNDGETPGIRET
jgi:hypothetical protein